MGLPNAAVLQKRLPDDMHGKPLGLSRVLMYVWELFCCALLPPL